MESLCNYASDDDNSSSPKREITTVSSYFFISTTRLCALNGPHIVSIGTHSFVCPITYALFNCDLNYQYYCVYVVIVIITPAGGVCGGRFVLKTFSNLYVKINTRSDLLLFCWFKRNK